MLIDGNGLIIIYMCFGVIGFGALSVSNSAEKFMMFLFDVM